MRTHLQTPQVWHPGKVDAWPAQRRADHGTRHPAGVAPGKANGWASQTALDLAYVLSFLPARPYNARTKDHSRGRLCHLTASDIHYD